MFNKLMLSAAAMTVLITPAQSVAKHHGPKGNIVAAASATPDFSTLVTALKAAKLTDTLASKGPFTVFAPTNDAFSKIDAATLQSLLKPENRDQLAKVLTYHVVAGQVSAAALVKLIQDGGGQAVLTTVEGSKLTAKLQGESVVLVDESNRTSVVTKTDLVQSNGVIHEIDTVVLPG
jgi:uncharacterized surface protein with fasciclin (FAS1) repeats